MEQEYELTKGQQEKVNEMVWDIEDYIYDNLPENVEIRINKGGARAVEITNKK